MMNVNDTHLSTYLQSEVKGLHLTQQNNLFKRNPSDPDFAQHAPDSQGILSVDPSSLCK